MVGWSLDGVMIPQGELDTPTVVEMRWIVDAEGCVLTLLTFAVVEDVAGGVCVAWMDVMEFGDKSLTIST